MEKKDTPSQAERRERSKTHYHGIEGLILRIKDETGLDEEGSTTAARELIKYSMMTGTTIEYNVSAWIASFQEGRK